MLVTVCRGAQKVTSRGDIEAAFNKLSESLLGFGSKDVHKNGLPFDELKKLNELHLLSLEAGQCVAESRAFWGEKGCVGETASGELKKECERLNLFVKLLEELKAFLVEKECVTGRDEEKIEQALCNAERCRHRLQLEKMCVHVGNAGKYLQEEGLGFTRLRKAIECMEGAICRIYEDGLSARPFGRHTNEHTNENCSCPSKKHPSIAHQAKETTPFMSGHVSSGMYSSCFPSSSSECDSDAEKALR
ncbi:UNVERIFIED_CONTAM: hypothetical protein PYX00_011583 [Menopon gallinae]|uniref:Uncharacterized protein n=1 Tax=Menopon gallinae TaxID=328185 RepID=A0AAW2H879_9NEOP